MAMAANRVACSAETAVEAAPKIAHWLQPRPTGRWTRCLVGRITRAPTGSAPSHARLLRMHMITSCQTGRSLTVMSTFPLHLRHVQHGKSAAHGPKMQHVNELFSVAVRPSTDLDTSSPFDKSMCWPRCSSLIRSANFFSVLVRVILAPCFGHLYGC